MIIYFVYSSSRRNQHVHLRNGFERRGKSTGVAKNGIRHCQLSVGIECALRVHSGWDCRDSKVGGSWQKRKMTPWFWENSGWMGQ